MPTSDSPATDAAYTPNPAAPFFIFEAWYEVTVRSEAFGAAGFGYPRVESMHASPSKTGNHTEPLTVVDCSVLENLPPPPPPPPDQSVKSEKSQKSQKSAKSDKSAKSEKGTSAKSAQSNRSQSAKAAQRGKGRKALRG